MQKRMFTMNLQTWELLQNGYKIRKKLDWY